MSDITLSKAVRSNLLNLQSTANLLGKSQERLSSGLRVNSALDNPTNFFTAQGLNSRANDLSQLSDAVSNAVQTVAAADKGISAITKLVESAQATARQALQTAATVAGDPVVTAATITGTDTTLADADILALDGETLSISVNGGTAQTITFASGALDSLTEFQTALDGLTGVTGTVGAGGITFVADNDTDTLQLSFSVPAVGTALGVNTTLTSPTSVAGADVANPKRAELVSTYNDLLGQIDALAKDASFNGVNLLNGDSLSVLFNEDGSSKINIAGVTNTSTGLGLTALTSTDFDTNSSINSTLDDLKGVIDTLRSQSAKFGSNLSVVETRQDFTKQMVSVLQTGAANLTLADTNEEAANVLALQTRQQLSSTALSLASQADQNVLRLF
jgi:flagellin-like hook-associated protein FlgL